MRDAGNASSKDDASQSATSLENTEIVEQYKDKEHELLPETMDLNGFEFVIAGIGADKFIPEEGADPVGDLKLEVLRDIQTKYNCVILTKGIASWDEALSSIVSGEEYANVIMPSIHQAGGFLQSKLCADFLSPEITKYVDLSKPWWNDTMAYASNVLGKVYAGESAIHNPAMSTWVIYFNKNIAEEVGIGENELYDLWEKGEWNWDALSKYAKLAVKDLDGSGSMDSEEDRWGMVAPGYDCVQAFSSSARVASITTENGMNPTYTFNTAHAISALTKLNALFTSDGFFRQTNNFVGMFSGSKTLFLGYVLDLCDSKSIRPMEDDWGILPIPKGPKEGGGWQDKYMSRVDHNAGIDIIPVTVEDKTSTALVLEAIAYGYFRITNDALNTMALTYCRDDRSIDVVNTIYNTSTFEISQFFYSINNGAWNAQVERKIMNIVNTANCDVSGDMQSVAELAQQMIDDYFNGN